MRRSVEVWCCNAAQLLLRAVPVQRLFFEGRVRAVGELDWISNTMKSNEIAELHQFLGAYFHQDWAADGSEPDDMVHLFINDGHSLDELMRVVHQISNYIEHKGNDVAIEEGLLSELGCYYRPSADGIGAAAWLRHVARLLVGTA
jgi:hypothetical protein